MIPRIPVAIFAATLALAANATGVAAGPWEAIETLPGHAPSELVVGGNRRVYFRVTPEQPLEIPIQGPGQLRITSRFELPAGQDRVVQYTVRVLDAGRELEKEETESAPSHQVSDPAGRVVIGKSRKMTVDVAPGMRRLTLQVSGAVVRVRLQQAGTARSGQTMVTLTPVDAPRFVTVIEGEKSLPYATAMPGRPVKLRLVGPTSLDLMTRLDFDPTMRGSVGYTLAVSENGKRLRLTSFKTSKSMDASFKELRDRVPSKFDRFQIDVPAGLHEYQVELVAPEHGAVEVHARIPQPSVGGEE